MTEPTSPRRPRRRRAAALLLATGAVITASGTWAAWQSTGSLTQSTSSATVTVNVADGGSGATEWATSITNLLPGDFFYRWVNVTNTGSVPQVFAGSLSGVGDLHPAMTAWISSCTTAFTPPSPTCGGTPANLLGTEASPAAFGALASLGTLAPNETKYLKVKVVVDPNADQEDFEDTASTLTLSFTGTATGGADRTEE